jgi:hypothetical protein
LFGFSVYWPQETARNKGVFSKYGLIKFNILAKSGQNNGANPTNIDLVIISPLFLNHLSSFLGGSDFSS